MDCFDNPYTSGIGRETAFRLAERGASVAIVGRNRERGRAAVSEIDARNGDGRAELYVADLASQSSVHRLATEFRRRHDRLDVLVNNAGTIRDERSVTEDGVEATFAINHLAPFLFTRALIDLLAASAPARIITVSSGLHERGTIDFEDVGRETDYDAMEAYTQSKLANVLFTYELADRLQGSGIPVFAADSGFVPGTAFSRALPLRRRLLLRTFSVLPLPFTKSVAAGARTVVYAATSSDLDGLTGRYLSDEQLAESSPRSRDQETRERLWIVSAELTGVPVALPTESAP